MSKNGSGMLPFGSAPLIRRMRSRRPQSIFGRPALFRVFQRKNALKPARCHRRMVLRLNNLHRTQQPRLEPGHPDQQHPVTAAQSKTRRRTPQSDAELMTSDRLLGSSRPRDLNKSTMNIPSKCRIASINPNHAMTRLPSRIEFSEGTDPAGSISSASIGNSMHGCSLWMSRQL
jgi:hypothetical protein